MKTAEDAREEIVTALRLAEVPETITENILALHDLAVAAAGQHGFDRAASLALACAESSRGRF
jgi:hypothetical protein